MIIEFTLLADTRCGIAEGPVWDDRRKLLFFVDILAPAVHAVRLDGSDFHSWRMPSRTGSIGLGESGRLIVALERALAVLDPDTGTLSPLADLPNEPASNRLNDGKVGPDGAFWVGSMDDRPEKEPVASLYRIDGRGRVTQPIAGGLIISNGLAWSPDGGTMFHSDSRGPWIDRYAFEPASGRMSDRTRIASGIAQETGRPDGAACDSRGRYWSAGVTAGRLNVWSRDGAVEESYPTPVPAPTMPCFCGDDLLTLVVTSLRRDDCEASSHSGSVFIGRAPVAGAPVARWADI
ncbi:SMP-30/gluconolactonase/LRE family protein [Microvirga massiliensis]|uniref:SMP-30/gluconolactonase/LRE family protein n=1 Tax=Microvirga massiliensis TaxID=1033741 RepID=UPI00062B787B|nr:SMP-30/gluconolactonase/LRE family protein [Microvirga massiliensis]